jgi:hypothetical protein
MVLNTNDNNSDYMPRCSHDWLHKTSFQKRNGDRLWWQHLEDASADALPRWPGLHLLALLVDEVPVKLTATSVNIHLCGTEPTLLLPEVTANPEEGNDKDGEIRSEEVLDSTEPLAKWGDSSVKLYTISGEQDCLCVRGHT